MHLLFRNLSADESRPVCYYCGQELRPACFSEEYLIILAAHHSQCELYSRDERPTMWWFSEVSPFAFGNRDLDSIFVLTKPDGPILCVYPCRGIKVEESKNFVRQCKEDADLRVTFLRYRPEIKIRYERMILKTPEGLIYEASRRLADLMGWTVTKSEDRLLSLVDPIPISNEECEAAVNEAFSILSSTLTFEVGKNGVIGFEFS